MHDLNVMRANLHLTDAELGTLLGRTEASIQMARHKYGMMKTENRGQFAKGTAPWNKGLSYDPGGDNPKTRFRKGNEPHTTKPEGHVSLRKDGYLYLRITKKIWVLYHRHIWEQHHGPVPEAMAVVFRDGNKLNCELANLELITRGELIRRNRNTEKAAQTRAKLYETERIRLKHGLGPKSGLGRRLVHY